MQVESETFIPDNSIIVGLSADQIEKRYRIKVLKTSFYFDPQTTIHVEGEWNDVARFEKDLFTLTLLPDGKSVNGKQGLCP